MTALLLLCLAALCPPDATRMGAVVGFTFTNNIVAGEPVIIGAVLMYAPVDPDMGYHNASFSGGTLTLTIDGHTFDLTPTNGVPLIGPPECAVTNVFISTMRYTFCEPGQHVLTVNYTNGQTPLGTFNANSTTRLVQIACQSPMRITKQGDNAIVRWYGFGRFSLEASEDLKAWQEVGVVGTGDECEDLSLTVPSGVGARFYRYRRLQ